MTFQDPDIGELSRHGLPEFASAPSIVDDPVPFVTERFRDYGCFEVNENGDPTVKAMSQTLACITSLVTGLNSSEHRYSVRFSAMDSAATSMDGTHQVIVGTRPMLAKGLSDGQKAAIMVGLGYHETGHIEYSEDWFARLDRHADEHQWSPRKRHWSYQVLNLAHDLMLEYLRQQNYPGYKDTLPVKNLFNSVHWPVSDETQQERYTIGLQRGRFWWASDWTDWGHETEWWDKWIGACESATARKPAIMMGLIEDALDHIRCEEEDPEPEPEGGEPDPEGEETEEDETQPQPGGSEPSEGEEDEDEEAPGEGEGEEEGEEEPGEGEPEPGQPEPEPGEGEGEGGEETDGEGEEPEPEPTGEPPEPKGGTPALHGTQLTDVDRAWQESVDEFNKTQVAGRDKRIVGSGSFHKRELRIKRLEVR